MKAVEQSIDDRGNNQKHGREMLRSFIDHGFGGSQEQAGLALGWPQDKLEQHLQGELTIDDDLVMKMRGIAKERNFDIE
jgi:hypothetical protein